MTAPIGYLITQLRTANIAGKRIRAAEPAGASDGYEGDALGPGHYKRFVVLTSLSRVPVAQGAAAGVRVGYRVYGVTPADAGSLARELGHALHLAGGRGSGGLWIFQSIEETGGAASKDPDTGQPYESGVISVIATG